MQINQWQIFHELHVEGFLSLVPNLAILIHLQNIWHRTFVIHNLKPVPTYALRMPIYVFEENCLPEKKRNTFNYTLTVDGYQDNTAVGITHLACVESYLEVVKFGGHTGILCLPSCLVSGAEITRTVSGRRTALLAQTLCKTLFSGNNFMRGWEAQAIIIFKSPPLYKLFSYKPII